MSSFTPSDDRHADVAATRKDEDWFGPNGSKRYHYFVGSDLRALCGKWMLWMHPEDAGQEWGQAQGFGVSGDCAACARALAKREATT